MPRRSSKSKVSTVEVATPDVVDVVRRIAAAREELDAIVAALEGLRGDLPEDKPATEQQLLLQQAASQVRGADHPLLMTIDRLRQLVGLLEVGSL